MITSSDVSGINHLPTDKSRHRVKCSTQVQMDIISANKLCEIGAFVDTLQWWRILLFLSPVDQSVVWLHLEPPTPGLAV